MTVEEFCDRHLIELCHVDEMKSLAVDCVNASIYQCTIDKTFEDDDTLTIVLYPAINYTVACELLWLLARSPQWDSLREKTGRRVIATCRRQ